ncbi:hypothetical protein YYG_03074 [Plasmodium vinckei petteri]|uniref:Ubiquitin activating enzyme, putative n=1 Tax=Plasmodium vinckei petteri TaxID=138298 RepID=W7B1M5_PLAVN|nr:hypothetical protein YYG_03074 [Plasmodium vinckei petteri]CAD2098720.1 ubiquitin activating enzyme, putative [Plasmodium vinckei petteri]
MNMTIFFKYIFLVFIYFFVQIKPNNKSNIYALNYNTNKTSRTFSIYFPKYSIKKCHHKNTEKRGNRFPNLHKLCNLSVINKKVQNGTNLSLHTPLNKNGDQTQKENKNDIKNENKKESKQENKQENGEEDGINVLEKEKKYSRQIYTHGYNEEKKIRKSKILIIGMNGVSSEICKNLIICGVNEIGIYDNDILTFEDIDNLFFCDNNLINKEKKSLACLQNLKKLNNNCKIKAITNNLFDNLNDLNIYDIVVSVNQKEQFNIKLNNICRLKKKKFIAVNTVGIFGRMFVDFGDFIFSNGVNNEKYVINKIEFKDEDIIMHYLSNYENIHLSENDMVDLCVSGLNKTLNIQCKIKNISKKENKITVSVCNGFNKYIQFLNWIFNNNFMKILSKILTYLNIYFLYNIRKQIEKKKVDNIKKKYNKYKINNNVSIRKMHEQVRLNYVTLEDYLNVIKKKIKNNQIILINMFYKLLNLVLNNKKGNANDLTDEEVCFLCYDEIVRDKKGYVGIRCNLTSDDLERFKTLCLKKKKNMNVQVINDFLSAAHIELPPFSMFWGSLVTQQILKGVMHKFKPIYQTFHFDKRSLIPFSNISKKYYGKYMHQLNFFGKKYQNFLNNLNILLVGSGALGCEFLKLLALMGVSCSQKKNNTNETKENKNAMKKCNRPGFIRIVDYDIIEESNLSRQFLFTANDIGKSKCQVAAENIKKINEDINCFPLKMKIDESILDTKNFYFKNSEELNKIFYDCSGKKNPMICILCLDNLKTRYICDEFCLINAFPIIEAGIEGMKGSSQIVIPFCSETYSNNYYDINMDNENNTNSCTITSFPRNHKHVIEFSKGVYNNYFFDNVLKINNFLNNPIYYIGELCNYDNINNLLHFFKLTKIFFNNNLDKNVENLWNNIFVNNINHLLSSKDEEIIKYFESLEKLPQPIYFNKKNKDHLLFYNSAITAFKKVLKRYLKIYPQMINTVFYYKTEKNNKIDKVNTKVPFETALKTIAEKNNIDIDLNKLFYFLTVIKKNANSEIYSSIKNELYDLFNNPAFIMSLKYVQERKKKKAKRKNEDISTEPNATKNEEDTNFFIPLTYNLEDKNDLNLLFSITNIRNTNYNFSKLDILEFFKISNNIIPSIITVVSMISSLAAFELYKLAFFFKMKKGNKNIQNFPMIKKNKESNANNLNKDETKTNEKLEEGKKYFFSNLYSLLKDKIKNSNFNDKKLKDSYIYIHKDKVYVKKSDKILFYFFDINYDEFRNISKLINNQYINLEDNFLTSSQLNQAYEMPYNNSYLSLLKNGKFSIWNYIYIDIFYKEKNYSSVEENQKWTPRVCGFPPHLFESYDEILPEQARKKVELYLKNINVHVKQILEKIRNYKEQKNNDSKNSSNDKIEKGSKISNEYINKLLNDIEHILNCLKKKKENKANTHLINNLNDVINYFTYLQKKLRAIEIGINVINNPNQGKEVYANINKKYINEINTNLKKVYQFIEKIKDDLPLFFNVNENQNDITLDELITHIEFLFNVTIQTIGVKDKVIYSNSKISNMGYSRNNNLYDVIQKLFKTTEDKQTYILDIFAIDNINKSEIVLPSVQVNMYKLAHEKKHK